MPLLSFRGGFLVASMIACADEGMAPKAVISSLRAGA